MERVHLHFSKIALKYRELRITDSEPVLFIKEQLQGLPKIEAADVGCGVGRYDLKLFDYLGTRLYLVCIDYNKEMLTVLLENLREKKTRNFCTINASAVALPLPANLLDAVVTFNAVHHFRFPDFLKEASRVLRDHGKRC
jgi:ubiquinone/menaquinone biosynthesis C-methylase UbiE